MFFVLEDILIYKLALTARHYNHDYLVNTVFRNTEEEVNLINFKFGFIIFLTLRQVYFNP